PIKPTGSEVSGRSPMRHLSCWSKNNMATRAIHGMIALGGPAQRGSQVSPTPDSTLADPQQIIADLRRELAKCRARSEPAYRQTSSVRAVPPAKPQMAVRPVRVVCHERRMSYLRCATVREMKEGPSSSVIRSRSQATASCCGQKPWWCCVKKARERHAVRAMKEDPSDASCRGGLQTAMSCIDQKL